MNEPYAPMPGYSNQPGYPPPPRQGMGCFAKGCITVVVVLMLLGIAVGAVGWYVTKNISAFVSPTPVSIRTFNATDEQYRDVIGRYTAFIESLNAGRAATLTLSGDDLNTLIARDPGFKDVRGKLYLDIKDGDLVAETSFPIPEDNRSFGRKQQRGYFNGRATFSASYSSGDFALILHKVESMDGKPLSDVFLKLFNKMDLGAIFTQSMRDERRKGTAWAEAMAKVQKIVVEKDHIVATAVEGAPATNPIPLPGQSPTPVASPSDSE